MTVEDSTPALQDAMYMPSAAAKYISLQRLVGWPEAPFIAHFAKVPLADQLCEVIFDLRFGEVLSFRGGW